MVLPLFFRQFNALFVKNYIIFGKHWFATLFRVIVFPLGFGLFLAFCPNLFEKPSSSGLGSAIPIPTLQETFDGSMPLYWTDFTNGTGALSPQDIVNHLTLSFSPQQKSAVKQAANTDEIHEACQTNFNGASSCFMGVVFGPFPTTAAGDTKSFNYTLLTDSTIYQYNVQKHTGAGETRMLPLQWAIDQAIIELSTGQKSPIVLEQPFTSYYEDRQNNSETRRQLFLVLFGNYFVIAFVLCFIDVVHRVAGGVALERSQQLTFYMQSMGSLDSARILSWHLASTTLHMLVWIGLAIAWQKTLFINTSIGFMVLINLVSGISLASWSFIAAVPFRSSPQLASTFAALAALALTILPMATSDMKGSIIPAILCLFFPSMFMAFSYQNAAALEVLGQPASFSALDPLHERAITPMLITTLISIFLWPVVAIYAERWMYGIVNPVNQRLSKIGRKNDVSVEGIAPGVAISIRNLHKRFKRPLKLGDNVVAVDNLTLDIPTYGIFVLLGANGAGKSTTLSILSGLQRATSGTILFEGGTSRPSHGALGIVPQQNVLFNELTCLQNVRVWNAIKAPTDRFADQDLEQLIRDCDLTDKMDYAAGSLSGGQKRKLQLAIGLVGGSKIVLVDECTSGVDALSRRAVWKTLTTYRKDRTIVLTTHFLDEADFLADRIAVLAAPGKLIASDTPVALKSTMGEGYSISITFHNSVHRALLLQNIRSVAPATVLTSSSDVQSTYHLKTRDSAVIAQALRLVEGHTTQFYIASYDLIGTTIEDIFLHLVGKEEDQDRVMNGDDPVIVRVPAGPLDLTNGRPRSFLAQAFTIFHKRALVARRSWIIPLLALAVGISGGIWPTTFGFMREPFAQCGHDTPSSFSRRHIPPSLSTESVYIAPPSLEATIFKVIPSLLEASSFGTLARKYFVPEPNLAGVRNKLEQTFMDYRTSGAIVLDFERDEHLVSWKADYGLSTFSLFSVASNVLYDRALNTTTTTPAFASRSINPGYTDFASMPSEGLTTLIWLIFWAAAMATYPGFFAIYIAKERHSNVQAMQLSNGLTNPLGLWLGHLLWDSMFTLIIASVLAGYIAATQTKFQYVGVLWFAMCLYGLGATLFAYIVATIVKSPLGAFGAVVISQFIILVLFLVGNIVPMFTGVPHQLSGTLNAVYYGLAVVSPINSLTRAGIVSVNMFSTLCEGNDFTTTGGAFAIHRFGGPILFLILWIFALLFLLSQVDTGFRLPLRRFFRRRSGAFSPLNEKVALAALDVVEEARRAADPSNMDPLRVIKISKSFDGLKVVDDVSFSVPQNGVFAMLGPNGAGKTTTFDIIHGKLKPSSGDVLVNDKSIIQDTQRARIAFGVCPQFSAVDAQLSVKEHLYIYGRLKGLARGQELEKNIEMLLEATGLDSYTNRKASKLSGGNKRKLSLAIALIGNPSVVLVDEYSTGIDAKGKRDLWGMLKQVTKKQSVLLTTHSMEEASYLATKVGIMSKRMLAIGTPNDLETRNASYEVHFSCRNPADLARAQAAMSRIPGARMADDVATRFEVPIGVVRPPPSPAWHGESESAPAVTSVADLVEMLAEEQDFPEFTVGKSTLETAFIRIINDNGDGSHHDDPKVKGMV